MQVIINATIALQGLEVAVMNASRNYQCKDEIDRGLIDILQKITETNEILNDILDKQMSYL